MPELTLKLGDSVIERYVFDKDVVSLGRSRDNDIVVENLAVSRNHARVKRQSGKFVLTDLNSANGTYVNGVRISKTEIVDGDVSQALGGAVRFHHSDGHTPGLLLAEIVGPEIVDGEAHGGVVFCADLIPGRPWVHVPITMGYDRNAELLIDEKRAFLEDKLARNVHLFFTHDPGCALAQVTRDDKGKFGTAHERAELHARSLAA